jgi:diadenylate cyclase
MRHRAAVGLSEETDALVIAVSEETKSVSVAHNGRIVRYAAGDKETRSSLLRWVRKAMPEKKTASEQAADWFKHRMSGFGKGKSK